MAEIKSTLDLVMERTKHMQFSDDERQAQRSKETGAKIRGLLQKLVDQAVRLEHFKKDYQRLKLEYSLEGDADLIAECVGQLRIVAKNKIILDALEAVAGVDRADIEALVGRFQNRYHELVASANQRQSELLAGQYHISGTAVVANPNLDEQWVSETVDLENEFQQELSEFL